MTKMSYKVTLQYAKGEEKPLAEFSDLDNANFFIARKKLSDAEKHINIIYRLFDHNQKMLDEFNVDKINRNAPYATGERDLPRFIGPFKVSKESSGTQVIAAFTNLNDTELFVEGKLTQAKDDQTNYYIFENDVLITQMNEHIKKQLVEEESKAGRGQSSSFQPTPLNTAPRPSGSPPSWIKDKDKEDKDK